ncbi:hypothetical protein ACIQ4I_11905 [Rummeliibacillus sp. NPDC094406]|uniref:hypothetical protein n=1 Tax=Rummeliibacillus sp. NPDC094406 TaxID=3364511 RepID=UPI0037F74009
MKKPIGVTLISYFYIFGIAALIFITFFLHQIAHIFVFAERFGFPDFPEELFRVLLAIVTLIVIYGYMNLKAWGFWLMVLYSISFGIVSYLLLLSYNKQLFIGNFIWSAIVLIYSISVHKSFFNTKNIKKVR